MPGVAIALLDRGRVVWAEGFGSADPNGCTPARADTVWHVASISKLFTAVAVLRLVTQGRLDLDAPVARYVPEFAPENPFGTPITLRHLLTHRAGLVREPPVGNYFDDAAPSLADTIASLSQTRLVHAPGQRLKYSNAGVAVAGRVVEVVSGKPFAEAMAEMVLAPLGLADSSFAPDDRLRARLAPGLMWTYDGREFPAPRFLLGVAPAANLCSTVVDLVRFAAAWSPQLAGAAALDAGSANDASVRSWPEFAAMLTPQPPGASDADSGMGLGFFLGQLDGHRTAGHNGAYYGCASQLLALPDDGLAVAVVTNVDSAIPCCERIADHALRALLARRRGETLPPAPRARPLGRARAQALAGTWVDERGGILELCEHDGELLAAPESGYRAPIRDVGGKLVAAGRLGDGSVLEVDGEDLRWNGLRLRRRPENDEPPPPPHAREAALIGEYGRDHDVLYVLERHGRLAILIEWFAYYPLLPRDTGSSSALPSFVLDDDGMYASEEVQFIRGPGARPAAVRIGGVTFPRRTGVEDGPVHVRPESARDAHPEATAFEPPAPPHEAGPFRAVDLVDVAAIEPGIRHGVRAGEPEVVRLQRPVAEALARVHRALAPRGLGLLVFAGYRPWHVTKSRRGATLPQPRSGVAGDRDRDGHGKATDVPLGANRSRGATVDVTLCDLGSGTPVDMGSNHGQCTPRARLDYPGGTSAERWYRTLLRRAMAAEGFTARPPAWWQFDHRDWRNWPILDVP